MHLKQLKVILIRVVIFKYKKVPFADLNLYLANLVKSDTNC